MVRLDIVAGSINCPVTMPK